MVISAFMRRKSPDAIGLYAAWKYFFTIDQRMNTEIIFLIMIVSIKCFILKYKKLVPFSMDCKAHVVTM